MVPACTTLNQASVAVVSNDVRHLLAAAAKPSRVSLKAMDQPKPE